MQTSVPLAERIRPMELGAFVGQRHLLFQGHPLREALERQKPFSMLLVGPPGSGKTSLFVLMAGRFPGAILTKGQDITAAWVRSLKEKGSPVVLLVDEAHRLSRIEQDRLLPMIEKGEAVFIGATTENPNFYLGRAILSRLSVFRFEALKPEEIVAILKRGVLSLQDGEKPAVTPFPRAWLEEIARAANGDARVALGMLERVYAQFLAKGSLPEPGQGRLMELAGQAPLSYDRAGDEHYDEISAFIKSMRGSDPDAALYWLVRMIEGGEDPLFLVRRMLILAAEDIGNADPNALVLASALKQTIELVGLPEGLIPMAQVCIYLSLAPKSNAAYTALNQAKRALKTLGARPVPDFLRNPVSALDRKLGKGVGYIYPHDDPERIGNASFLPKGMESLSFYHPGDLGFEKVLKDRLEALKAKKRHTKSAKQRPESS